ncbi:MAG TPA: A24 family peptidase [Vicinamibacterales bacterium]|nr:A24 family peptidase [Vicinamibacterales bacterium]
MLAAGLTTASALDYRTRRIPNALTAAMAATGLALSAAHVNGISPAASLLGIVIGVLLMLPGHVLGATGAGDVKLMGAVGAFIGPALVVTAFFATAIAGGVLAVIVAARRGRVAATFAQTGKLVTDRERAKPLIEGTGHANRFAYGPAITIGTLAVVLGQLRG